MSLKLEQIPYEFEGKTYMLRCNMAVLEDIQEAHGGDLGEALNPEKAINSAVEFLTAMLNDYAEDMEWPERWTPRQLKKRFSYAQLVDADILGLFWRGTIPQTAQAAQPEEQTDQPAQGN